MAVEKARQKLVPGARRLFLKHYRELLEFILGLRYSEVHRDIMDEIEALLELGMTGPRAIKKTLNKYSYLAGELFTDEESTSDESSSNDEQRSIDDDNHDGHSENNFNLEGHMSDNALNKL